MAQIATFLKLPMRGTSVLRTLIASGLLLGYSAGFILLPEIHTHEPRGASASVVRTLPRSVHAGSDEGLPFCAICFILGTSQAFVSQHAFFPFSLPVTFSPQMGQTGIVLPPHSSTILGRAPPSLLS